MEREKAGALLVSLKPPVLMKGNTMNKQKRKKVPKRHKNPGPGTQVDLNIKSLYWAMGLNIKKHQRVSAKPSSGCC